MSFRILNYVTALVFLGASMVVYQNVVTPMLRPPQVNVVAMPSEPDRMLVDKKNLRDLFAPDAWQLGTCKQLQTSDGMLLFEHGKQVSKDQWKLWPITVVIGRGMSGDDRRDPVVMEARKGAEIKFSGSLDVMSGGAPPIQRGRLVGDVRISRRAGERGKGSIELRTANVGIDSQKIWTTEAIEMKVGNARLVGRDLTLHLAGPAGSTQSDSAPVLDRMELVYLDEFIMPLGKEGIWGPQQPDIPNAKPNAMISVACGGRLEYDFAMDVLQLRDSVSLTHQVAGSLADRFDCELLEMSLNDPTNRTLDRNSPLDWLSKIVATGSPAVANLPSLQCELVAEQIEFNAKVGLLQASGKKGIRIRRGGIQASLTRLVYQFDPQAPEVLGAIDAPGAGIVKLDVDEIPLREARWLDGFKLRPVGKVTTDDFDADVEFWVDGQFHAWLSDGGEFKADSIAGVLTPDPRAPPGTKPTLVPDRLDVQGSVWIDTVAIAAKTNRMRLFFVDESDPTSPTNGGRSEPTSPLRQWVAQPRSGGEMVAPVARSKPTIHGDAINAQLRRNENGLSAKKLSVTGAIRVSHQLKAGGTTLAAVLTGEHMELIDGGGEDVLQLTGGPGEPARFELGDGFFVGPQIQIRPSDNVVWINAAGEFRIPSAILPSGLTDSGNTNIVWTTPPHCRWLGEMIFDGRSAVLTEGVELTAELEHQHEPWELRMSGDRLQVDLSTDVQVRDMQTMRGAAISQIKLMQTKDRPVIVQALQRATDRVLQTKHMLHAKTLTFSPSEGAKLVGEGPGWYRGWSRSQTSDGLFGRDSKSSMLDGDDQSLTGIHLVFNDSIQAGLASKHLDFLRGVRIGVRTVSSWDESFDAEKMDAIAMGESTLDCDRLRFSIDPNAEAATSFAGSSSPTPWEMEATSGVVFRTKNERGLLEGTASRVSYSSAKDRFTIEGAANRAAIFRQTLPDGSPGPEGAVKTITIRPSTMTVENAVLERLNIAAPPAHAKR